MISTRDGAALYLKTRRVWPPGSAPGGRLRDARPSLSLYSNVYGAVAAPRFAGRACRNTIPHQLAREVES